MKKRYFFKTFKLSRLLVSLVVILILNSVIKANIITIATSDFVFTPANVTANVGDTIKWQWVSGGHTTTCNGVFPGTSLPSGAMPWDAFLSSGNPVFTYIIAVPGTYNYVCIPHAPSMAGTIVATSSGGTGSLMDENFNYPAGDSLGAHGWVSFSGGATNVLSVTSPGLSFPGYPLSNIGNATTVNTTGQDAYKNFSTGDSTGALYAAFMVRVMTAQAGDYFMALLPPTSTTLYTARFYAKDSSSGLSFGLSKSTAAAGGITYSPGTFSYGTTYIVIIKYQFNPGTSTDDVMRAYIFSSAIPSTEPGTPTIGPVTGTQTDNTLGRIALRQGTAGIAPTANVDGIRITKSWTAIVTSLKNPVNNISSFYLEQNYPNPFNPNTTIKFVIPQQGLVNLTVYNSLGIEIGNLTNSRLNAGTHSINFDGSNLNSGVYFYKLSYTSNDGSNFIDTKKLILLK